MKNKTYRAFSWLKILLICIFLLLILIGIYLIYLFLVDEKLLQIEKIMYTISSVVCFFILFVLFVCPTMHKVKFEGEFVKVCSDWNIFEKIQYPCSFYYHLVEDVRIVGNRKNSKGGQLSRTTSRGGQFTYIEVSILGQRTKKRILITFYSKNQIKAILNELISRIKLKNPEFILNASDVFKAYYSKSQRTKK